MSNEFLFIWKKQEFSSNFFAFFYTFDVYSGFFQVRIAENSRYITPLSTPIGQYQFKVLPQGLSVSANAFSRVLARSFDKLQFRGLVNYIDDFCNYARTFLLLLVITELTFQIFEETNLKLETSKCRLLYTEIELLGHKVSAAGIQPALKNRTWSREFLVSSATTPTPLLTIFCGSGSGQKSWLRSDSGLRAPTQKLPLECWRGI
jgi:Reverse transcriptase (RNA-dependent DNA polymerase)